MQILRAEAMGMCFGVRDALDVIERLPDPTSVTIHGELVHNEVVLHQLSARGFVMERERDRGSLPRTLDVLVTAHGISETERRRLEDAGKRLIDTTCPLVTRAHRAARALQDLGYYVLVIGKRGHVEVEGTVGDLVHYDVIQEPEEVRTYPSESLGIVCQTTVPDRLVRRIRAAIALKNPDAEVRFVDTVCRPTKQRQRSLERLLNEVDAMVVVGGKNSNNTRELVALCQERGVPALHVQGAADLKREWFAGIEVLGLTAGTSTLESTIDEVHDALSRIASDLRGNDCLPGVVATMVSADRLYQLSPEGFTAK
jgi:4-hydroxy-3-methylbut-2-enyl diphosphate reductase